MPKTKKGWLLDDRVPYYDKDGNWRIPSYEGGDGPEEEKEREERKETGDGDPVPR
jgi:hypothetical protein